MPDFHSTRRVPHTAAQMFALIADVEAYPEFLPLCRSLIVRSREDRNDGTRIIVADMTVSYRMFSETFSSKVLLDEAELKVHVDYLAGPLSHLENRWAFRDLEGGFAETEFYLSYGFSSRTFQILMGAMFEKAFGRFADAFERRADQVYGVQAVTGRHI